MADLEGKENKIEEMKDDIEKLEPTDRDIIVVNVPEDSPDIQLEKVVDEVTRVLNSIEPSPGLLVVPTDYDIQNVPEQKMNDMGWFRRVDVQPEDEE